MNKQAIIERIMADARNIKGNAQSMYGSVKDKLATGPEALYDQFRTKVVDDANASAKAIRDKQIALGTEDYVNYLADKDADGMKGIAKLLGMNEKISNKVLSSLNPAARQDVALRAAEKGLADNSLRGLRRRGAEWVAANPDTAIPVGVSAASAGGAALITASGAAIDALTKNMAQALKTEENRDNVLSS